MEILPTYLEQHTESTYTSPSYNKTSGFGLGTRDRNDFDSEFTLNLKIVTDKVGLDTFETFFYENLNGGVEDFQADNIRIGSITCEGYRMVEAPSINAYHGELFNIILVLRPINKNNRYNNIKQVCPLVPNYYVIPSDNLFPC